MHDEYALVQINLQVKRRSLRRGLIIDLNAAVRALAHQRYEAGYIIAQTRAHDARHRRRPCLSPVAHRPTNILKCTSTYHRLRAASMLGRSEEHTSELQSLMRISYAVFCLKKKKK